MYAMASPQKKKRKVSKYFRKPEKEDTKEKSGREGNEVTQPSGKDSDSENPCVICLQKIVDVGRISCAHEFCVSCIEQWAGNSNTCPLCKKRFNVIKRVTLVGRNKRHARQSVRERIEIVKNVCNTDQKQPDDFDDVQYTAWSPLTTAGYLSDGGFVVDDGVVEVMSSDDVLPDDEDIYFDFGDSTGRRNFNNEDSSSEDSDCNPFTLAS
jgi:hypothetical protein